MAEKQTPDQTARTFYGSLLDTQCHVSWGIFSAASKQKFAEWALNDLKERNPQAVAAAGLGLKEIKLMFDKNDTSLIKFFWKRFFFASGANEIFRLGYFSTDSIRANKAVVKVTLKYPNGQVREIGLPMVKERGGWKLAYVEHNLPF